MVSAAIGEYSSKLICRDCGNDEEFARKFFGNTLVKNYLGKVSYIKEDSGLMSENSDWFCTKCDSKNIMTIEDMKELLRVRYLHTDNKGKWHKNILDESRRNKELGKEIMVDNL